MNTVAQVQAAKTAELVAFYNSHNAEKPVKKFADRATAEKRVIDLIDSLAAKAPVVETAKAAPAEAAPKEEKELKLSAIHFRVIRNIARSEYTSANGAEPTSIKDIDYVWANCVIETSNRKEVAALEALVKAGYVAKDNGVGADSCVTLTEAGYEAYQANKEAPVTNEEAKAEPKTERKSNAEGVANSWRDASVVEARLKRDGVSVEVDGALTEYRSVRQAFNELGLPDSKHIRFRMKLKAAKSAVFTQDGKDFLFNII